MAWELLITSAPRGLKPGSSGFCTVLATRGIPPNLVERLEALSGYRHVEIGGQSHRNPVVYSHTVIRLGGDTYHILSRIADAGRDYSGRSNKLAHHLVLRPRECPPAGPAALLSAPRLMRERWEGEVAWLETEPTLPQINVAPGPCGLWQQVWGDAGWGGVLAYRALARPEDALYLVYPDTVGMLGLFAEAVALLPESHRWRVTFTTHDMGLADVAQCRWRAAPAGSPEALQWRKTRGLEIWDLTRPRGVAPEGRPARAGREGRFVSHPDQTPSQPAPQKQESPVSAGVPGVRQPPELPPQFIPVEGETYAVREPQLAPPQLSARKLTSPQRLPSRGQFWKGFGAGVACALLLVGIVIVGLRTTSLLQPLEWVPNMAFLRSKGAPPSPEQSGNKPADRSPREEQAQPHNGAETTKENPENISQKQTSENKQMPTRSDTGKENPKPPRGVQEEANTGKQPPHDVGPTVPAPNQDFAHSSDGPRAPAIPDNRHEDSQAGEASRRPPPVDSFSSDEARPIDQCPYDEVAWLLLPKLTRGARHLPKLEVRNQIGMVEFAKSTEGLLSILRVQQKNGPVQYYVYFAASLHGKFPREQIIAVTSPQVQIETVPIGVPYEIKPESNWRSQKDNEFVYRLGNSELLRVKIEQGSGKVGMQLTVPLEEAKTQGEGEQKQALPEELSAKLGCFFDDPIESGKRIWVTVVNLKFIKTGHAK